MEKHHSHVRSKKHIEGGAQATSTFLQNMYRFDIVMSPDPYIQLHQVKGLAMPD